MEQLKIYKSLDKLPIYNYFKISETGDLKYLYITENYEEIEINDLNELQITWENIFSQHKKINLDLQNKYFDCFSNLFEYLYDLENKSLLQKCHNSFNKYLKQIDLEYSNLIYDNKTFINSNQLYQYVKNNLTDEDFLIKRLEIFDYHLLKGKKRNNSFNLYELITFIRQVLNFDVNEFETSVNKFFTYLEIANKKIESQNKK